MNIRDKRNNGYTIIQGVPIISPVRSFKKCIHIVRTAVIGTTAAAQGYTYSGEVRGHYESQLAFQVNGKIIKRNVQLGSTVNAGDILLQIDAKDVAQTLTSYSAQVDSAESRLQLAESDLKRYRELLDGGAISQVRDYGKDSQ